MDLVINGFENKHNGIDFISKILKFSFMSVYFKKSDVI